MGLPSIYTGIQTGIRETAAATYSLYSMDGFERWVKAAVSDVRILNIVTSGLFGEVLKTLEAQKDLYLATSIFTSLPKWIATDGAGVKSLQLPKKKDETAGALPGAQVTDWAQVFYTIGNFFETGKFLQRYAILSFPNCTQFANAYGAIQVFSWKMADVPWLNTFCDKPKEFFVVIAASIDIRACFQRPQFWDTVNLLKLANNTGKILLICFARPLLQNHFTVAVIVMDFVTNHAALFVFIIKERRERAKRYGI